ncbi:MAG: tetratricopeptide repeat protein [Candidatus Omnitrophota bacterium]
MEKNKTPILKLITIRLMAAVLVLQTQPLWAQAPQERSAPEYDRYIEQQPPWEPMYPVTSQQNGPTAPLNINEKVYELMYTKEQITQILASLTEFYNNPEIESIRGKFNKNFASQSKFENSQEYLRQLGEEILGPLVKIVSSKNNEEFFLKTFIDPLTPFTDGLNYKELSRTGLCTLHSIVSYIFLVEDMDMDADFVLSGGHVSVMVYAPDREYGIIVGYQPNIPDGSTDPIGEGSGYSMSMPFSIKQIYQEVGGGSPYLSFREQNDLYGTGYSCIYPGDINSGLAAMLTTVGGAKYYDIEGWDKSFTKSHSKDRFQLHVTKSDKKIDLEQLEVPINLFKRALEMDPNIAAARVFLGEIYFRYGDPEDKNTLNMSIIELETANRLNPCFKESNLPYLDVARRLLK